MKNCKDLRKVENLKKKKKKKVKLIDPLRDLKNIRIYIFKIELRQKFAIFFCQKYPRFDSCIFAKIPTRTLQKYFPGIYETIFWATNYGALTDHQRMRRQARFGEHALSRCKVRFYLFLCFKREKRIGP